MAYPEDKADETWQADGATFSIIRADLGHWCGYVRFPARPVAEEGYRGILTYVPVHGGITWAEEDDGGMVYGFDCAHSGDDNDPNVKDVVWVKAECQRMAQAISIAAGYEDEYLAAKDDEARAYTLDSYHARLAEEGMSFELMDNFGAMINVLAGKL
jgi:hypothetical protein